MEYGNEFEKEILQRLATIEAKLDDFKEISNLAHLNNTNLSVLYKNVENLSKQVAKNEEEISQLKSKPNKKWETLIITIISTITTIFINILFMQFNFKN